MNSLLALIFNLLSLTLMLICTVIFKQNSYKKKVNQCFFACQVLTIAWIICHILDIFSLNLTVKILFSNIGYLAVCSIGAMFLLFSLYYVKANITKRKVFKAAIFIPAAFLYFLKITDPVFHMFFKNYLTGETYIGFYFTVGYNYILLLTGICLMLIKNIKNFQERIPQIILISMSAVIPLIINLFSVLDLFNLKYDFTPVSFSVTSILVFLAIYKYEFSSINPLAIKYIMSSLDEAIIITDKKDKITYINEAMKCLLGISDNFRQKHISSVVKYFLKDETKESSDMECFFKRKTNEQIITKLLSGKYLRARKILVSNSNRVSSNLFVFSDITDYYNYSEELSLKNRQLVKANDRLMKMNVIEKNLAVERERNRIAQELHDSLGHSLVSVMTLLKLSQINKDSSQKYVDEALDISTKLLSDVRDCVSGIRKNSELSINQRVKSLIDNIKTTNTCLEFSVIGEEKSYHIFASDEVFSIIREAITNSIRHGSANKIDVILKFSDENIGIYIIDNGVGCDKITEGYGLKGMREKIKAIGGNIEFSSLINNGFSVRAFIPVEADLI